MKALALGAVVTLASQTALAKDEPSPAAAAAARESVREMRRERRDVDKLGWYVPDFAKLQTAGYLGTLGAGLGYAAFDDVLNVALLYGFTPESRAGHDVHALKLGVDVRPLDVRLKAFRLVPIYAGASLLYAFGDEYFTRLPARYRRIDPSYYPPTSLHWSAELGLALDYVPGSGRVERHGIYYEVVTVDSYLISYLENSGALRLTDAFASALGYRCAF